MKLRTRRTQSKTFLLLFHFLFHGLTLRNDDNSKIINKNVSKTKMFQMSIVCLWSRVSTWPTIDLLFLLLLLLLLFFFIRVCINLSAPSICSSLSHELKCLHLFWEFVHSFTTFILFSGFFFSTCSLLPRLSWIIWMLDGVHNALVFLLSCSGEWVNNNRYRWCLLLVRILDRHR